jgi:hypothetical protein
LTETAQGWKLSFHAEGPDGETMDVEWCGEENPPDLDERERLVAMAVTAFTGIFETQPVSYRVTPVPSTLPGGMAGAIIDGSYDTPNG